MRRASCQTLGLAVLALAAAAPVSMAFAQTTAPTPAPQRHLNWAGRGEFAMPVATAPNQPNAPQRRSNRVIPHGVAYEAAPVAPTAAPEPPRRTLTPASAWLRPAAPAPTPAPAAVAPQPQPQLAPVARTVPDFIPDQGRRGQPVPAEIAHPAPVAAVAGPVDDPMAPRRDAPIFRIQQTPAPAPVQAAPEPQPQGQAQPAAPESRRVATVTANPNDRPAPQGARYYSVHRQAGREPDALTLPQPTYVDALAISTPVTIASQDLAQPEQAPTLIRDAQGRVRVQPAAPEGDYQ